MGRSTLKGSSDNKTCSISTPTNLNLNRVLWRVISYSVVKIEHLYSKFILCSLVVGHNVSTELGVFLAILKPPSATHSKKEKKPSSKQTVKIASGFSFRRGADFGFLDEDPGSNFPSF